MPLRSRLSLSLPTLAANLALALLVFAIVPAALGFSSGPPNGRTGAPGELTCNAPFCHNSFAINSGSGSLTLTGIDTEYEPDTTYRMQLTLADPVAQRWGFELTALSGAGASVGSLDSVDVNTQTSLDTFGTGRLYIKHTSVGTALGTSGSRTWEFDWTSPAAGAGAVTFYFAGNAANGNLFNTGDLIYTNSITFEEATSTAVPAALAGLELLPNRPNPFNPSTTLSFRVERDGWVRLAIFDTRGHLVRTLEDGHRSAGTWQRQWDGRDGGGRPMASGTYFVKLTTRESATTRSIVLVK